MSDTTHPLAFIGSAHGRRPFRVTDIMSRALLALRVRRERNQLADLSDQQLIDIGITREQALQESTRSLMDIPEHRRSCG